MRTGRFATAWLRSGPGPRGRRYVLAVIVSVVGHGAILGFLVEAGGHLRIEPATERPVEVWFEVVEKPAGEAPMDPGRPVSEPAESVIKKTRSFRRRKPAPADPRPAAPSFGGEATEKGHADSDRVAKDQSAGGGLSLLRERPSLLPSAGFLMSLAETARTERTDVPRMTRWQRNLQALRKRLGEEKAGRDKVSSGRVHPVFYEYLRDAESIRAYLSGDRKRGAEGTLVCVDMTPAEPSVVVAAPSEDTVADELARESLQRAVRRRPRPAELVEARACYRFGMRIVLETAL